jgi:diamine N-acetyltransferase
MGDASVGGGGAPLVLLGTENLALGPLPREVVPLLQRWFNDPATLHTAGIGAMPWTLEAATSFYERITTDPAAAWFAIYTLPEHALVGFAGLRNIDFQERTAEYAITLGEAQARGKGYGTATTRLLVEYAFHELGLESVFLDTVEYNQAGIRAYQKAGFREIGRRSRVVPIAGRLCDAVYMEAVREDSARDAGRGRPEEAPQPLPLPAAAGTQHASAPPLLLAGALVALGPADKSQMRTYARWFSDLETMRTQGDPEPAPRTPVELERWYADEMSGKADRAWFSAYELAIMRLIGFVELHHIDHRNRRATMSLMVGEPDASGKGYGTELARLITRYGAHALNLRNIDLEVYEYNPAAIRAYTRAGFREFARRRQAHQMGGRLWDIVLMEWLA